MLQYILKRLLIMVPTFLGISLFTLFLVHLAPGDPVQLQVGAIGTKSISPEEIEALRRTYYLHLPVLLNLDPEDATTATRKLIEQLRSDDEDKRTRAVRPLAARGTLALIDAVALLESRAGSDQQAPATGPTQQKPATGPAEQTTATGPAQQAPSAGSVQSSPGPDAPTNGSSSAQPDSGPDPVQSAVLAGLEPVAERMGLKQDLSEAPDPVAFWKAQVAQYPADPALEAQKAVEAFVRAPDSPEVRATLARLDTYTLAPLIDTLKKSDLPLEALKAICEELSRITGTNLTIQEEDTGAVRGRILADWQRWWGPRRADYVTFKGVSRVAAIFTETQYSRWLTRLATFDFDRSSRDNVPIRQKLGKRLKVTLTLALASLFIAYLIAIPLGVFSAARQYSVADRVTTVVLFMLYSLPTFWVAMLLQQYLCGVEPGGLDLFPLIGLGVEEFTVGEVFGAGHFGQVLWHLVLPVFVLTYRTFAYLSRYQRVGMLDIIRQDFIRTARAKGLPERIVIGKHALRNSVLPIITLMGMQMPFLVGGAVIVESIFQINGMGFETLEAIRTRDINWIMASVTVTSLVTMAGILVSDILYALVDPRIQVGARTEASQ